ncbi:FAD-dependent monooxygenase, partial [bacterium]|nr:FAD-dependent monooxygenase [bacterium]
VLKSPRGEEEVQADYVCGCDGAHSAVRHLLGLGFPGGAYSQVFFVADAQVPNAPEIGLQISVSAKDFCILMPIPTKGTVRLTGLVPPESETKQAITYADVAQSVQRNTGLQVQSINWFSAYRVHHRVADAFQVGRVFLAGDAGHIHSPAGGQGMNTGIGDAINLAWKLVEVLQGRANAKLLESYGPERRGFALVLVRSTDTAFRLIASRGFMGSVFRAYILPRLFAALTRTRWFVRMMFRLVSQTRIQYRSSPLSGGNVAGVQPGDRLPWIESADNFTPLATRGWQVHVYGECAPSLRSLAEFHGLSLHTFAWSDDAKQKGLQRDAAYLVRPDGYVGWAGTAEQVAALERYLRDWGYASFPAKE